MMKNEIATQTTKKKSKTKFYVIGWLILVAILCVFIYVVPNVSDAFKETYVAEYGTLEAGAEADCLFVRDETVFTADSAGTVTRNAKSGKLVRTGSKIVTLSGTAYYSSDKHGIVSYYYDGLEESLTSDALDSITIASLEKAEAEDFSVNKCKKEAAAGDPIFKIIDNTAWYLVAWLSADDAEGFTEGNRVYVDLDSDTRLKMKVKSVTAEGDKQKIVLSCNRYYEDFDKYRAKSCNLVKSSRSGILIEKSSIVEEDGHKGVYVKDKFGNYNFTRVSVLATDGDTSVVEQSYFYDDEGKTVSTVSNYDEILRSKGE